MSGGGAGRAAARDGHPYALTHNDLDADAHRHTDIYAYGHIDSHAHVYPYADTNCYTDAHHHPNACTDFYTLRYTHIHADADCDADAYRYTIADARAVAAGCEAVRRQSDSGESTPVGAGAPDARRVGGGQYP